MGQAVLLLLFFSFWEKIHVGFEGLLLRFPQGTRHWLQKGLLYLELNIPLALSTDPGNSKGCVSAKAGVVLLGPVLETPRAVCWPSQCLSTGLPEQNHKLPLS